MGNFSDLTGQRFGRLTAVSREVRTNKSGQKYGVWKCKCDCGGETYAFSKNLKNGHTRSCGCLQKEFVKNLKFVDLTGRRFGRLTVIEQVHGKRVKWKCRCECGNECEVTTDMLNSGNTKSCGCLQKERASECSIIDLSGQKFGYLTVIERAEDRKTAGGNFSVTWVCQCDCGKIINVRGNSLRNGATKSCGCKKGEMCRDANTIHGESNTRLYSAWRNMISRCENKNSNEYHRYGGRGIRVCHSWRENYQNFRNWAMANGYSDDLTIDRIDNNGNYEPSNCQWLTKSDNIKKMHADKLKEKMKNNNVV